MRKLLFVAVLILPFASHAGSTNKDSVVDGEKNNVVDARGDCVRSKWDGEYGDCGSAAKGADKEDMMQSSEQEADTTSVYFNFDQDTLRMDAKSELDTMLNSLVSKESTELKVTGFADRIGDSSYNYDLSKERAKAVSKYLGERGVRTINTSVQAKGETAPVTNCSGQMETNELIRCLQEDRRVDISIVQ